jgi:hypothetical protein
MVCVCVCAGGGGHFNHQSTASFTMRGPYKETKVDYAGYNLWHNGNAVDEEDKLVKNRHSTDIYTNVAIAQLSAARAADLAEEITKPFFLYLSYQAVHAPMEVPVSYIDGTVPNGCDAIADDAVLGDKRKVGGGHVRLSLFSTLRVVIH